jgi:membrane-associated PAP2 superfamily phosphatase
VPQLTTHTSAGVGRALMGWPAEPMRVPLALLAGLLALLAWDASGLDLTLSRWVGTAAGFAWRDSLWTATVLHDGGRWGAWAVMGLLAAIALRIPPLHTPAAAAAAHYPSRPSRGERGYWLAVMLLCMLLVPAIKRFSTTSCPWDLAEFGGAAQYLSHWRWGVPDGGGGRCFPSGHAVAAFGFLGQYFMWRRHDRQRARLWLWGVCAAGVLFGAGQWLRGAHFVSHTLWSAWLCALFCATAGAVRRAPKAPVAPRALAVTEAP